MIDIYTDGGSSGNPGPGGWAYVILYAGETLDRRSGGESLTTNNRMELEAVIQALEFLQKRTRQKKEHIRVHTDSQYVKQGVTHWIHTWLKNGWKTSNRQAVKNQELWERLWELSQNFEIQWEWIKGHAGDLYNEACDRMVQQEIQKFRRNTSKS
ncbi:MAG: ribonuclease H [Candidatus Methanofastidiosum methylothiophilum]|uniref:ribonuclease H n=1 Tax=Candidatus Methanofastidiosum methylothiophilum TaxID=1705564 RepID=A0A150J3W3_9EURY|nr:MAG: ribonuclease H [Candidatus Methanofastidiosum methylthiophilus]